MAYKSYPNYKTETLKGTVQCHAECSCDHQGEAMFALYPPADKNQDILRQTQPEVVEQLHGDFQRETGREVRRTSVFMGDGGQDLSQVDYEFGADGKITRMTIGTQTKTIDEISERAQHLNDTDHAHSQELSENSINRSQEPNR